MCDIEASLYPVLYTAHTRSGRERSTTAERHRLP